MLFLAVDEIIPLHESTVGPIRRAIYSRPELFDALRAVIRNGTLFHAILNRGWVIPYTAIAMAAAVAFLRIAKTLSKKKKKQSSNRMRRSALHWRSGRAGTAGRS